MPSENPLNSIPPHRPLESEGERMPIPLGTVIAFNLEEGVEKFKEKDPPV